MRLERSVDLGGFSVVVKELTVAQVRNLLAQAAAATEEWQKLKADKADGVVTDADNLKFLPLLNQKFGLLLSEVANIVVLPKDKAIDDLALSEIEKLWEVFVQLNPFVKKRVDKMSVYPG